MFTGIVEELGEVLSVAAVGARGDAAVLRVRAQSIGADTRHGASVAVNGVCLTVVGHGADDERILDFDVMGETLKRSVLGRLRPGDPVNLERAARVDSRLDGHVVQGHVDGTGTIVARNPAQRWDLVRFAMPHELARFVAEKGAIAVDGVSLTVTGVGRDEDGDWFEVGLIPETLRASVLGTKTVGDPVNVEVDVLAKYVARLVGGERR
jgi:riboflavin synthase